MSWFRHFVWASACAPLLFSVPSLARADEDDGGNQVDERLQELFLGEVVYPQSAGEFQFSVGHFWNGHRDDSSSLPVLMEYGITDRLQVGVLLPTDFDRSDRPDLCDGLGNVEFEVYWNFLNDAESGWAAGMGFGYALFEAMDAAGEDAHGYEPFFVVYRDFGCDAVNLSAAVEIENPRDPGEEQETSGGVDVAYIHPLDNLPLTTLIELGTKIEADDTQVRLAPGAYFSPEDSNWELGCSLPIGLDGESPELGVFVLFTLELD